MNSTRVFFPPRGHLADRTAEIQHPAERGSWIWHPDRSRRETAFLRFRLGISFETPAAPVIHVSADQRFQLRCDGEEVTFGPDRCDREHWTVQSLRLELSPGDHELEALVWFIAEPPTLTERDENTGTEAGPAPPMAQISHAGGFLLWTKDFSGGAMNTGEAAWRVEDLTGAVALSRPRIPHYCDVGPEFSFDLERWSAGPTATPVIVEAPVIPNHHGIRRPGRGLYPADLPEQRREDWSGGRIRAVREGVGESGFEESSADRRQPWQDLLAGTSRTVPSRSELTVLWDLEDYHCGYPQLAAVGGAGASVEWKWAEALYEESSPDAVGEESPKGNRDAVAGKAFLGLGDRWIFGKRESHSIPALWWRAGRYVLLRIVTREEPLTLNRLGVRLTGYPFGKAGAWRSSDADWDGLLPVFERSLRCSAHETWTDTPYYEQMCYVGDTRLHALGNYAWFTDDRISRRALEQFDWSRRPSGLIAERYPSEWRQESVTYSMIWPVMIRDFVLWRDDFDFVRSLLPGLRSLLAEIEGMLDPEGLMKAAPGWPFVDWVPDWFQGCGPGVREADSSILNLHWVLCSLASAEVEAACGDPDLSRRCRRLAETTMGALLRRYWDADRQLLRDTAGHDDTSEHAQILALLTGMLAPKQAEGCLAALRGGTLGARTSVYASFYLLEAFYQHGAGEDFHRKLGFWRALPGQGFRCTPEAPEPSRSDAHAWGAHPWWHTLASIAGIRPGAPGFRKVRIAPCPGSFR